MIHLVVIAVITVCADFGRARVAHEAVQRGVGGGARGAAHRFPGGAPQPTRAQQATVLHRATLGVHEYPEIRTHHTRFVIGTLALVLMVQSVAHELLGTTQHMSQR